VLSLGRPDDDSCFLCKLCGTDKYNMWIECRNSNINLLKPSGNFTYDQV
jgi:hypothetical protein